MSKIWNSFCIIAFMKVWPPEVNVCPIWHKATPPEPLNICCIFTIIDLWLGPQSASRLLTSQIMFGSGSDCLREITIGSVGVSRSAFGDLILSCWGQIYLEIRGEERDNAFNAVRGLLTWETPPTEISWIWSVSLYFTSSKVTICIDPGCGNYLFQLTGNSLGGRSSLWRDGMNIKHLFQMKIIFHLT